MEHVRLRGKGLPFGLKVQQHFGLAALSNCRNREPCRCSFNPKHLVYEQHQRGWKGEGDACLDCHLWHGTSYRHKIVCGFGRSHRSPHQSHPLVAERGRIGTLGCCHPTGLDTAVFQNSADMKQAVRAELMKEKGGLAQAVGFEFM
eukprot:Skav235457  [mRNA]  locus=scaffold2206:418116:422420:- [translate_table: standard]